MPRVKLRTILAGPRYQGSPGDTLDVDDATARELVAGRYAEPVCCSGEGPEKPEARAWTKDQSLAELGITRREAAALAEAGVTSLLSLEAYLEVHDSLADVKGIGRHSAAKIEAKLAELAGEDEDDEDET